MKTLRLKIDPDNVECAASRIALDAAASILRGGGLVAFPTETVYGLGANALHSEALENIFFAKQRPAWDPLIVHILSQAMLPSVVDANMALMPSAIDLMAVFWPGPLTLLLPRAETIPPIVTAGRPLVGVRLPSHPVARALLAATGFPIAAPSANRFGRISPTRAAHVLEDLDGRIDAVLDGGETTHGVESTVIDASREPVVVYRPGMITLGQIQQVCEAVEWKPETLSTQGQAAPEALPSPGLGIRHYAPRARLLLIGSDRDTQADDLLKAIEKSTRQGFRLGVMLPENFLREDQCAFGDRVLIFKWGDWQDLPILAHRLFAGLRELDAAGVACILCPMPPNVGVGTAIRDRLTKAAMS